MAIKSLITQISLKCSFAHGKQELKTKIHLSNNYKTKPCKQYFFQGVCSYGYRCQYLHNEIQYEPEKVYQFQEFLITAYADKQIAINFLSRQQYNYSIKLKKLENLVKESNNFSDFLLDSRGNALSKYVFF